MGIFGFLKNKQEVASPGSPNSSTTVSVASSEINHKRFHVRYLINSRDLFKVKHKQFGSFNVVDLSHHGALIESVNNSTLDGCSAPTEVELNICGTTMTIELSQCQKRKSGWGLVFKHVNDKSIRAIGSFIEPLRCGSTAVSIPGDPQKDGIMSKFRKRFQGDGPFDLVYEADESGKPNFIMVTIRRASEYGSVIWDKGLVITKKSIDSRGDSARMSQTAEIDHQLVWVGAVACLGLKFSEGAIAATTLNEWLSNNAHGKLAKIG